MSTRADLEIRLRNYFENNTYYSSEDFLNSIQDGYDETVAFSGVNVKATTLTIQPNLSYYDFRTLIPDYLGLIALFNSVTRRWMIPTSVRKLDKIRPDWETCLGTPEYFVPITFRYLALFRKPAATYGDMYVFYVATAPTIGQDDEIIIPADYQNALSDYCITDLLEQQQEFSKAMTRFKSYVDNLKELQRWAKAQRIPDRMPSLK